MLRMRVAFIAIAMVLSAYGARLVQLQGIDPHAYAIKAAAAGTAKVDLPAQRGDILDRNGVPLAGSVTGKSVVVDPSLTADQAPALARELSNRLDVDYIPTLAKLRKTGTGGHFQYIARQVPSTLANDTVDELESMGYQGLSTYDDPVRSYPGGDVAANLIGFLGTDKALAGMELAFNKELSGKAGYERYTLISGRRVPLGESTTVNPIEGQPLRTTIDRDLQFYVQKVLNQVKEDAGAISATAVVMDARNSELLAVADAPTYNAAHPLDFKPEDYNSRALMDVYEPGSVEKVLTAASLIDAGKVTPRTRIVVPGQLARQDRVIKDWFDHGTMRLTFAGVIAKSSNIGTVLAADKMTPAELIGYLRGFGLGKPTGVGILRESGGLLLPPDKMTWQNKDRVVFGQSVSVNAVQMAAAINTVANNGVYVSPSLIKGEATNDAGQVVGTEVARAHRVVSPRAARQTAHIMERVLDPVAGVAPGAAVPGYRVSGKTGTAQRVDPDCACYRGSTYSFAGFAPTDDPRFTVYVVVHSLGDGSGGTVAGPAFAKIMGYTLNRYQVPPTGTGASRLPVEW